MLWPGLAGFLVLLAAQPPLVFPTSAEIVYVVVSVTDGSGQPVRGLKAGDFTVGEDGGLRPTASLASFADVAGEGVTEWPVDFVLLLDTSESMQEDLHRARDAAVEFAGSIPHLRGRYVVSFNSRIGVWPYQDVGPAAVLDQILGKNEVGGTRLFDAVLGSIPLVTSDPTRRSVIVALTDGEDTGGKERFSGRLRFLAGLDAYERLEMMQSHPVARIATELQKESVTFYAISFAKHLDGTGESDHIRAAHGRETLEALAKSTGGLVVESAAAGPSRQFARIRDDIAAQYVLGFVPAPSATGKVHKLKVEVALKGAKVRHRLAYETKPPR